MASISGMTAPIVTSSVEIDGAKLREMRKLKGDTLKGFAAKCGISFTFLSQLERGDRNATPPVFARICNALGLAEDDRARMVRSKAAA